MDKLTFLMEQYAKYQNDERNYPTPSGVKLDIGSCRIFEAYSFYVLMTISFAVLIFSVLLHQKGKFVQLSERR
jgi:hypothetical protein